MKLAIKAYASFLSMACLCLCLAFAVQAADFDDPAYKAAITDAMVRSAAEISRELWGINPQNPYLEWEGAPGASRVKLCFWTSEWVRFYEGRDLIVQGDPAVGDAMFFFIPAQMRLFFQDAMQAPKVERLEKLLGLPLETGKSMFAEVWVSLDNLVRPSPDPEVGDHEVMLDFPSNQYLTVSQIHKDWFNNRWANIFSGPWPYPWTGLGYTYDWGSDIHVGLSEFIVPVGQTVHVKKVYTNQEYFGLIQPR
jgi:hypothetical protein